MSSLVPPMRAVSNRKEHEPSANRVRTWDTSVPLSHTLIAMRSRHAVRLLGFTWSRAIRLAGTHIATFVAILGWRSQAARRPWASHVWRCESCASLDRELARTSAFNAALDSIGTVRTHAAVFSRLV